MKKNLSFEGEWMPPSTANNPTQQRFEYPGLLVKDFEHWSVTLRRHQVTLGALVLLAKSNVTAWPELDRTAFTELKDVTVSIERSLSALFGYDKINYLMLMMVDPNVHFHVFPRYQRTVAFADIDFADAGWPKAPDLASGPTLDDDMAMRLIAHMKSDWRDA
ncbi:MAG: HIT family protein [Pseudomonadota bacterium]